MRGMRLLATVVMALALEACTDCDDIKSDAAALVARNQTCGEGDACEIVSMFDAIGGGTCIHGFGCFKAMRADADLDAFGRQARALEADFEACGECASASCDDPNSYLAECDVAAGRCILTERDF